MCERYEMQSLGPEREGREREKLLLVEPVWYYNKPFSAILRTNNLKHKSKKMKALGWDGIQISVHSDLVHVTYPSASAFPSLKWD